MTEATGKATGKAIAKTIAKAPAPSASFGEVIWQAVAQHLGARLGLAWLLLLAVLAVLAPLLANSYPLLQKVDGQWASPAWAQATAQDVGLLCFAVWALVLSLPIFKGKRWWLGLLGAAVIAIGSSALVSSPRLQIYDEHRTVQAEPQQTQQVLAPIPYSPQDYLRDFGHTGLEAPLSAEQRAHWFGTEQNGADVLSRMIHASRISLGIGFVATGIAMALGILVGGLMGYFSGRVDMLGMRLVEIFESIPTLFLLLIMIAFFERSLYMMMVIIGLTSWPGYARYVRAEFLRLRQQEFVQAAIALGLPLPSILFRHMLPNGMAPLLVGASFGVASAILTEATLSFLGLGLVDEPSWGQMLNQAVQAAQFHWWLALFPGLAIFFTVFAYNMIGEALRDALDPHLSRSQ